MCSAGIYIYCERYINDCRITPCLDQLYIVLSRSSFQEKMQPRQKSIQQFKEDVMSCPVATLIMFSKHELFKLKKNDKIRYKVVEIMLSKVL